MPWSGWPPLPPDVDKPIRVLHHREGDGWWTHSPDVEGWSAAGNSYAEVVTLSEEGIPFALKGPAKLEHYVPGEQFPPSSSHCQVHE